MREHSIPVVEFPKCGGTWLSSMLGSYFDLPFPRQSVLPILFPSILHGHWTPQCGPRHGVFLTRHPFDVAISYLFHTLRAPVGNGGFWEEQLQQRCGAGFRDIEVEELIVPWITAQRDLAGSPRTWTGYTNAWRTSGLLETTFVVVRYEDLIDSAGTEMDRVATFLGYPIDETRRDLAVNRFDFTTVTGRRRGQEDRESFSRSATPGDWRSYASQIEQVGIASIVEDAAQTFGYECGS